MDKWPHHGLDDDLRPRMGEALLRREPFALVTVCDAEGGPRGIGAQMVVTEERSWGFVSGGCIEADIALHGRRTLADREARHLVYGRGSPWVDTRLPCGGRLDLLVERIEPDDEAIAGFVGAFLGRQAVRYQTDGVTRQCLAAEPSAGRRWVIDHLFEPTQRLIVVGSDPIALATIRLAQTLGWATAAVWLYAPEAPPACGVVVRREAAAAAIAALAPDPFTAIAIATHDQEHDEQAIVAALQTSASYIGVLGARRRIPDRLVRLRGLGTDVRSLARLRMPIGLPIGAAAPWEIAVSVVAAVIAARRTQTQVA